MSELTSDSPTYYRTTGFSKPHYFEAIQIEFPTNGSYRCFSRSQIDTYAAVYQPSFNPDNVSQGLLGQNDDGAGEAQFLIRINTLGRTSLVLVITTYSSDIIGNYTLFILGPGQVTFSQLNITSAVSTTTTVTTNLVIENTTNIIIDTSSTIENFTTVLSSKLIRYFWNSKVLVG